MKTRIMNYKFITWEMRCSIFLWLIVGFVKVGQGQTPPIAVIQGVKNLDENCFYRGKYSEKERRRMYPFNVSDTVKLVSFRYHKNNYPVRGNTVITDSLFEEIILTKSEVNQFTDVLYNNITKNGGNPNSVHIGSVNQCYEPRNAILFVDKAGKLKAYFLICFHCRRFEQYPEKAEWDWDFCDQKFEMIRQFFVSTGIKYGTDLSVTRFPAEE